MTPHIKELEEWTFRASECLDDELVIPIKRVAVLIEQAEQRAIENLSVGSPDWEKLKEGLRQEGRDEAVDYLEISFNNGELISTNRSYLIFNQARNPKQ